MRLRALAARVSLMVFVGGMIASVITAPTLAANNPAPIVYQPLLPTAVAPGGPGFVLTVNGSGFVSGAAVHWNGSARPTSFVSAAQLTAAIPASDIATAGTFSITVSNPGPGGGTSNVVFFQVVNATTGVAFGSPSQLNLVSSPEALALDPIAVDLNGDGKLDLVSAATSSTAKNIVVRLGNGDGTFHPTVEYPYDPKGISQGVYGLASGDFNGDGKLDLIVTFRASFSSGYTSGTSVLLGNGDGTFLPAIESTQVNGQTAVPALYDLHVADVNNDGKLDLVGALTYLGGPTVLLGNGDGTFSFGSTQNLARGRYFGVTRIALGDFNGDGKLDVVGMVDPQYLVLFLGNGDGTFAAPSIVFDSYASGQGGIAVADFNGDGKLDVAYYHGECLNTGAGPCEGNLDFLFGNGNGTFQSPVTLGGLSLPLGNSLNPVLGDFNGDGKLDLAFGPHLLLLGTGASPISYSLLPAPDTQTQNVAAGFTASGKLDLVGLPVPSYQVTNLNLLLQVPPTPDFSVSATPAYQTVVTGNSATYTISVSAIDGFSGVVTPSVTGLPGGAAASFNPPTITGSGSTVLTVSTGSSTPTGSYALSVSLKSGALSHGGGLALNVGPAGTDFTDFTGAIPQTYSNISPGNDFASYAITIIPLNGFTGTVSFSVSGLPAGSSWNISPVTVSSGPASTTLSVILPGSTPTGTYPFTLTATSGSHVHSTTLAVNYGPAGSNFGDVTGSVTPLSATIHAGGSTTFTVSLQPLYGFSGGATLSLYPLPSGVSASGNSSIPVPGSTTITITSSPSTAPGTYSLPFQVSGSNSLGGFTHTANVALTVVP